MTEIRGGEASPVPTSLPAPDLAFGARPALDAAACDACGSAHAVPSLPSLDRATAEDWQVVRCPTCGLLYTRPRPSSEWLARYYADDYYAYTPPAHRSLKQAVLRYGARRWRDYPALDASDEKLDLSAWQVALLARLARRQLWRVPAWTPGGALLDVGCGWGEYLELMRDLGWGVVGVERSARAAGVARHKLGLDVRCGDLADQSFPAAAFDVVTFWDVLEHLDSPTAALAEVRRILKPGGWLLAKVPNVDGLPARWFGSNWSQWDLPRHLYHFSPATLRAVLRAAGFDVVLLESMSSPATTVSSLAYLLNAHLGIPHWKQPALLRGATRAIAPALTLLTDRLGRGDSLVVHARKASL